MTPAWIAARQIRESDVYAPAGTEVAGTSALDARGCRHRCLPSPATTNTHTRTRSKHATALAETPGRAGQGQLGAVISHAATHTHHIPAHAQRVNVLAEHRLQAQAWAGVLQNQAHTGMRWFLRSPRWGREQGQQT
jgi:hypothetical protein